MITMGQGPLDEMHRAIAAAYPNEACGLLVGRIEADRCRVDRVEISDNLADDPRHTFEVDPALRFRLLRELRGGRQTVVGHFHSHPDGEAVPSATDRKMAWEPELIWLIAAVSAAGVGDIRAYRIESGASDFAELPFATLP